ncbi:unnamed protein product [Adineta ricciae]|uniref:Uncharacterized protein n=1 Tax=Adineta ricciae TaxID=249248 RepID=A0A814HGP6_ADIRI|nr:unnamed protein product [Adineta ricciae]
MNCSYKSYNYDPKRLLEIEKTMVDDGYVRIQFSDEYLPNDDDFPRNMEKFFINIIEKLSGKCLTHNAEQNSFVWHVQPMETDSIVEKRHLARSQTDDEFSFHTDCSYEINPPEYMALFVLEQDQLGGGKLEIIQLSDILKSLSIKTQEKLMNENFQINIPLEFRKSIDVDHINAPILLAEDKIRYRYDILSEENCEELNELNSTIQQVKRFQPELTKFTMIILNNQKFLHGRTKILDHQRHLLRIRFNRTCPYDVHSVYDKDKLLPEYLSFSNDFYDYLQCQHEILYEILLSIVKHYDQPTNLGEKIRQTFQFDPKVDKIIRQLNMYRPNYQIGSYRPDLMFSQGNLFEINSKHSFQPKICEINARFPFNGYFLSAALCSTDRQNRYSQKSSKMIETIIESAKFDLTKRMFIVKLQEHGYDIHLFQQYWTKKSTQQCLIVDPNDLKVENEKLIDRKSNISIEQCILELHQNEILNLSDEILEFFIQNKQINYINDLRTIFLLHDKRLFSLLSNQSFLYVLLNSPFDKFLQFIPKTFVIDKLPNYLKDSIVKNKQHWCIKPNSAGKGENITIGADVSIDEWSRQLLDSSHNQWIIQEYVDYVPYKSMNLCGMLFCFNEYCFNMGIIRMAEKKIVNISRGGHYIRPYVHQQSVHSMKNGDILSKEVLHEQLIKMKLFDNQWNRSVYISSSGGSGGKQLYFSSDIQQNLLQRQILVKMMLDEEIISDRDICLNIFQTGHVYRSMEIFNDFCTMANCTSIPMGANTSDEDIWKMIEYFKPSIIMGTPHRLMQLAFYLEKQEKKEICFEKIYFACEAIDQVKQDYFKRIFHCSTFLGFYGSAETGVYACQSRKYSSTKIYLYPKELVHIEIINSKIIVTNLIRKRNQLFRFDSGDLGRILPTDVNSKYGLIEVFRSQRLIMIGENVLSKSDIEETMKQIDLIEWQLIIDYVSSSKTDQILLLFRYVKSETSSNENLEMILKNYLQNFFDKQLTSLSENLILQFEAIQFNQLMRNETSNKLLKIIDKRL